MGWWSFSHLFRYSQIYLAGMLAGTFTTVIVAPGERIKCLLQASNSIGEPWLVIVIDCVKCVLEKVYVFHVNRYSQQQRSGSIPAQWTA